MKFPVLFRVFAVLNILAFFVTGAFALLAITEPSKAGLLMIWIHWAVAIWLFVSAIAWFFANKASYHFLYSLSTLLLIVSIYWLWFIWVREDTVSSSDRIMATSIPGIIFLYTVFLIVAMFYKPVTLWSEKKFSVKHAGITLATFLVLGVGLYAFGAINKKVHYFDATIAFPDSRINAQGVYSSIPGNESILLDFGSPKEIQGLSIDVSTEGNDVESFHFAKICFTDSAELDPKTAPNFIAEFSKDGDKLIAKFPQIKASQIQIYPLSENKQTPSERVAYFCGGISALKFYSPFDKVSDEVLDYNGYADGESQAEESEAPDESNGKKITADTRYDFYSAFLYDSYFSDFSEWEFDYSGQVLTIDEESNKKIGMIKREPGYALGSFNDAVKKFQGFRNYDYDRYFSELTGLDMYLSKARDYENENNGTAFNHLNPMVIDWAFDNLLPDPSQQILGYTAQEYYDNVFKRTMQMTVHSYIYVNRNDFDGEAQAYQDASASEDFYGPNYLNERYAGMMFDNNSPEDGWEAPHTFIGFWLRRRVDNTDQKCWEALSKIMQKYDSEWFNEILQVAKDESTMEADTTTYD